MFYEVKVTREDIETARVGAKSCPVATAILRTFSFEYGSVYVWDDYISINGYTVPSPASVRKFVTSWDNHEEVCPFKFTIQVVGRSLFLEGQ